MGDKQNFKRGKCENGDGGPNINGGDCTPLPTTDFAQTVWVYQ